MEIQRLFAVLRKWWWFILLASVVAGASSYLAVSRQPPSYQARAMLMVGNAIFDSNPTGNEISLPEQLAALYAPIANAQEVKDQTKLALGVDSLPGYLAQPVPNSPFIEIIVTDTIPERAQAVANELANQLILQSPTAPQQEEQEREAFISEQIDQLQLNIEETDAEILSKQEELQNAVSAREIASLESEIETLRGKLRTLRSTHSSYLSRTDSGAVNSISIFNPADLPRVPIGPNQMMTVVVVAAIGFILAFAAAYLLEYLDDTIKRPEDLSWITTLPIMPGISKFESATKEANSLVTLTDPRSPTSETYRALRTNIKAAVNEEMRGTLLVTSAKPNEGKSVTSANLAIAMAQQGHNVLLIDADLRRPTQHHLFGMKREPGLADLLHELNVNDQIKDMEPMLKGVLQRSPERRLVVMCCGSVKQPAFELLSSEIMHRMLDALSTRFDFILIDSPPVLAVSDAVALSTQVDYVLLVAEAGRVRRKELRDAESRLREANANIIGITLNRVKPQNSGFYYSYYQEYYEKGRKKDLAQEEETPVAIEQGPDNGEWQNTSRPAPQPSAETTS